VQELSGHASGKEESSKVVIVVDKAGSYRESWTVGWCGKGETVMMIEVYG